MGTDYIAVGIGIVIFLVSWHIVKRESNKIIKKTTQNAIDIEKLKVINLDNMHLNNDKVVIPVSKTLTVCYNIASPRKTPV